FGAPPPWTTRGRMPTARRTTTSWANEASAAPSLSAAPFSAFPPYLTTTILPRKRRIYGSASTSSEAGFCAAAFWARLFFTTTLSPRSRRRPVLVDVAVPEIGPQHGGRPAPQPEIAVDLD